MHHRLLSPLVAGLAALCVARAVHGQPAGPPIRDTFRDTWTATDALNRTLPGYRECGPPRPGRHVLALYEPWFTAHEGADRYGPFNIRRILERTPPDWGGLTAFHYWDEPLFGTYLSDDAYVIRKHMALLVNAGVDAIVFDVTNGYVYPESIPTILATMRAMRAEGAATPQVAFFASAGAASVARQVYEAHYRPDPDSPLWFRWQGRPLLLCDPAALDADLRAFFTLRKTWGLARLTQPDQWSFMELYPQSVGRHTPGVAEEMAVTPCQQETYVNLPTAHGRSYHDGKEPPSDRRSYTGANFAEQWTRALRVDPQIVFVSSWNEWMAQRFEDEHGGVRFVDTYSEEFSRDIEPAKGNHGDLYYYQLAGYIRRYKGVRPPAPASGPSSIRIDGRFDDWRDVRPEYRDAVGDTVHRDHDGWGFTAPGVRTHYVDRTGRNDIVRARVAWNARDLCFYVETRRPLTSWRDAAWMRLFLDTDGRRSTGWEGYDYVVNMPPLSATRTSVKRCAGGWRWATVGTAAYRMAGTQLELRIPRRLLGLAGPGAPHFAFHWADNAGDTGDITGFDLHGDSAPDGRFNYRF